MAEPTKMAVAVEDLLKMKKQEDSANQLVDQVLQSHDLQEVGLSLTVPNQRESRSRSASNRKNLKRLSRARSSSMRRD